MPLIRFFLTWWGVFILGALDGSLLVFIPFATDAAVIYLRPRSRTVLVVSAVDHGGIGRGHHGYIPYRRQDRRRGTVEIRLERPARAIPSADEEHWRVDAGLSAILPPPFPLTAFVLTGGALRVPMARFLLVFASARLIRFGIEALLARRFGTALLRIHESEFAQRIAIGLVIVSVVGTAVTIVRVWRSSRLPSGRGQRA